MKRNACVLSLVALLAACQSCQSSSDDSSARPAPPASTADSVVLDDSADALAVLRDYYAAINTRDYARAYAAWGADGPPGHPSLGDFAKGFADTDSVRLTTGAPGRVEGAAGSRYVSVAVTLRAFEAGGRETRYAGTYALRRSVVPGADAASRRWHLYRAELHRDRPR